MSENDDLAIYAIRLSLRARRDINEAIVWLAEQESIEIAQAWHEGFLASIAVLATLPRSNPLVKEAVFRQETRQMVYRRSPSSVAYRVLFVISGEETASPEPRRVTIIHIRHTSRRPISRSEARDIEAQSRE